MVKQNWLYLITLIGMFSCHTIEEWHSGDQVFLPALACESEERFLRCRDSKTQRIVRLYFPDLNEAQVLGYRHQHCTGTLGEKIFFSFVPQTWTCNPQNTSRFPASPEEYIGNR